MHRKLPTTRLMRRFPSVQVRALYEWRVIRSERHISFPNRAPLAGERNLIAQQYAFRAPDIANEPQQPAGRAVS